ncbi:MAG: hypothetical protein DHS20C18_47210 [Saprospiraceae bacterium]|nr:MAG: hypothetical protein DHS20C18_47210 [Saprospiraceae bacterium]
MPNTQNKNQKSRRQEELGFRQSHAFVIGINEYRGLDANLKTAVKDSVEIAKRLKALQGFDNVLLMNDVGKEQILSLLIWLKNPERPTSLSIQNRLFSSDKSPYSSRISWLKLASELEEKDRAILPNLELIWENGDKKQLKETLYEVETSTIDIQPEDSIVFYYAGHGFPGEIKDGPAGYLTPTDAKNELVQNKSLLPMDEVYTALSELKCKHTLLILDCCFAGKFRFASLSRGRPKPFLMPLYKKRYERYKTSNAWQVLVSAGPEQTAADSAKWAGIRDQSPFAKTLMHALEGKADLHTLGNKSQGDGIITATELFLFVWNEVESITAEQKLQHPGLFPMAQHREGEFIFLNPNISQDQFTFAKDPDKNPYKGLAPYEAEDANLFFGRDLALASLMRMIPLQEKDTPKSEAQPAVIFLTAPSAAGKSSLVRAGLFPSLQKQYGYEELLIFRPAAADQIMGTSIIPDEQEHKGEYQREKWTGFDALVSRLNPDKKQMIVIDQFEEFFTELNAQKERDAFEDNLLAIIENPREKRLQPLVILFTMRSDVEWQMPKTKLGGRRGASEPNYWQTYQIFRLIPMNLDELRQALTGPAWWALHDFKNKINGDFEDDGEELINQILKDVAYAPAALPLLSCLMQRFYEVAKQKQRKQQLIKADYEAEDGVNGVEGALSANAEAFYQKLKNKKALGLVRKIMLRMVNISDAGYMRRKVTYSEPQKVEEGTQSQFLCELDYANDGQLLKTVIDQMEAARILVQGKNHEGIPTVEPAHDALINHWPRCLEWIQETGRENLSLQRQLWQAVLDGKGAKEKKPKLKHQEALAGRDQALSSDFSELWETNPKLLQLIQLVANSAKAYLQKERKNIVKRALPGIPEEEQKTFKAIWADCQKSGNVPDINSLILTGFSGTLLEICLQNGSHWLNKEEAIFIQKSWENRIQDLLKLKRERDQAIRDKNRAEALLMSANLSKLNPIDLPYALQTLKIAIQRTLPDPPVLLYRELTANFYRQFEKDRMPIHPLCQTHFQHQAPVRFGIFSPAGNNILTILADHTANVWDLDGQLLATLDQHKAKINTAVFSSDGQTILTTSDDKTAKLWTLEGALLANLEHAERVVSAAISPSKPYLVTASADHTAKLWQTTGQLIATLPHKAPLATVIIPSDEEILITASEDNILKLWNTEGELLTDLALHTDTINAIETNAYNQLQILTASSDHTAKLWNAEGEMLANFQHNAPVNVASMTMNRSYILTASEEGSIKLWKGHGTYQLVRELSSPDSPVKMATFINQNYHDMSILVCTKNHQIKVWNLNGELLVDLSHHSDFAPSLSGFRKNISSDGDYIATTTPKNTVQLWHKNGNYCGEMKGHSDVINSVSYSPNSQYILSCSKDKSAKLWNLDQGEILGYFPEGKAYSPNGKYIFTKEGDLLNIQGQKLHRFGPNPDGAVAFSSDSQFLLYVKKEQNCQLWSIPKAKMIFDFPVDWYGPISLRFVPDSKFFLARYTKPELGNITSLWDLEGKQIATLPIAGLKEIAFSPDNQFMLNKTPEHSIKVWNITGELQSELKVDTPIVTATFSALKDQPKILTISKDNIARLWNPKGGIEAEFVHKNKINWGGFLPDNGGILTLNTDYLEPMLLHYWDYKGQLVKKMTLEGAKGDRDGNALVISPGGNTFLTLPLGLNFARTAKLWNHQGDLLAEMKHPANIHAAQFALDDNSILVDTEKGGYLWNLKGESLAELITSYGNGTATFSPNGWFVITQEYNHSIKFWPVPSKIYQYFQKEGHLPKLTKEIEEKLGINYEH